MEPTHTASIGEERGFLSLPAGAAVVALEDIAGRTLLVATTGDARRWARTRLGEDEDGERGSGPAKPGRADVRALASRVLAWRVGSALEAEWVYLAVARERLPRVHRVVAERWRAWFVHVDPAAEFPEFTKTNLAKGLGAGVHARRAGARARGREGTREHGGPGGGGVVLGPLQDKDAAGRFMEAVVDVFDLCRFQRILVQAPRGAACAYKEMGRCAAPCDGSETMESYRSRVRFAAETLGAGPGGARGRAEELLRVLGAAGRFEEAAAVRSIVERCAALEKGAFEGVRDIGRTAWVAAAPSGRPGWARLLVCAGGGLACAGDVTAAAGEEDVRSLVLGGARAAAEAGKVGSGWAESLGLMSRWMAKGKGRVRTRIAPVGEPIVDASGVREAVRTVLKKRGEEGEGEAVEEVEIEGDVS